MSRKAKKLTPAAAAALAAFVCLKAAAKWIKARSEYSRTMGHAEKFFAQASAIASQIDHPKVDKLASELAALRERRGRLFVIGVGGGAGNASRSVNDFRKLCDIEAYAPGRRCLGTDGGANDEGGDTIFTGYLQGSRVDADDAIFVFSVGGGDAERKTSINIIKAVDMAKARGNESLWRGRTRQRSHGHARRHGGHGSGDRSRFADAACGSMALPTRLCRKTPPNGELTQ